MGNEPILINASAVTAAVVATIGILAAFGVKVDDVQQASILGLVSAVIIPVATWLLARRQVVTVPAANEAIVKAKQHEPVKPFEVGS